MGKRDVKLEMSSSLEWDQFISQKVDEALPIIYKHALAFSEGVRTWYWISIKTKRGWSTVARAVSYGLATVGVAAPLFAASQPDPAVRLYLTQAGVTSLAVAGAILLCDTVFGWSSGWLRYVTTVTAMEQLTLQFQLDWANYFISRTDSLAEADKKPLFDVARNLELEIDKRRREETDGWVAEFNRGMAALNEMIKFQKNATEQAATRAQQTMDEKLKAAQTGGIEIAISHTAADRTTASLFLDDVELAQFMGSSWAVNGITPGIHKVGVNLAGVDHSSVRLVSVSPGEIARVEFKF